MCSTTTAGLLLPQHTSPRPSAALPIRTPGAPPPAAAAASSSDLWQQQMTEVLRSAGDLFDLVVVDESGQGLAPEVLLPLSLAKPQVRSAQRPWRSRVGMMPGPGCAYLGIRGLTQLSNC